MKKEFFVIALFLIISNIAMAQWPDQGALGGSSGSGGMMHRSMPAVTRAKTAPPSLKGDQTLAETWSSTIAAFGNNPDGMYVDCFAEDSDNLYLAGDFRAFDTVQTGYTGYIVHYNRKTGQWTALDTGVNNDVYALAIHNGILYAAGSFNDTYFERKTLNYIAEWNGTSWQDVGGGMNAQVNDIAFIGDTLYAGGNFTQAGGNEAYYLAYWDGQNWNQAAGGTSAPVQTLLATHDSLFVGGSFNYVGSQSSKTGIPSYGSAMLQDGNWSALGDGFRASSFAFYHDTLWGGGSYYGTGNDDALVYCIAFWNGASWQATTADTNIGTNGTGEVHQVVTVGDTLLALGEFSTMAGVQANGVAMYHNGAWSSLAGGLYGEGFAATLFNGEIYVGGRYTQAGTTPAMGIASLSNGTWTSLASLHYTNVGWQSDQVDAIATTSRYVFIGGYFETIAGQNCNHIAAYDKQLDQWTTLGNGVDGEVLSLTVMGDNLYVGGSFNHAGSIAARHIAMYNIATGQWSAMGQGVFRNPGSIATDGTSIYAALYNPIVGVDFYDYLGQWDGTKWNVFGNGLNAGYIQALAWQGSTLYATGSFSEADDATVVRGIAEIQAGGSWSPLNTGLNDYGYALAISGDSLYVGGEFTEVDGQVDSSLAVWNNATQEWNPIGAAGFNGPVLALAADGKGGVYAGGNFGEVAQVSRGNLVHWNGSTYGTVESGADNTVEALATDESALYAGGWFEYMDNGTVRSLHFAALNGAGVDAVSISSLPDVTSLSIYPNPASNSSTISVGLAKAGNMRIEIFNALGIRVVLLADGNYQTGQQDFTLDAAKLLSGIYFLRLTNDGVVTSENFIVERE
jgi:trimeric autotransporter adhesin